MHQLLENVFNTGSYTKTNGEVITIHSETSRGQCDFIQGLIKQHGFKASIEIGMAYGMSSLAIAEQIAENGGKSIIIDPFENGHWKGVGLDLIKQAGYESVIQFHEDYSYIVLPKLLGDHKIDFAYIDSTKLTDWIMVDFFYLDKLLEIGGIIVFDDVSFPSLRKLLRYLSQLPHYRVAGQYPCNRKLSSIRKVLLKPLVPNFLLKENLRLTDYKLGINAHCVALQKTGNDSRNYDWHADF